MTDTRPTTLRYDGGDGWSVSLHVARPVTTEMLRELRTEAPRALERLIREAEAEMEGGE